MKRGKAGQNCESYARLGGCTQQEECEISRRPIREAHRTRDRCYNEKLYNFNTESHPSLLSDETEYLATESRTSKVDTHLVTLKRLREKALKYTNQLDEIRAATKKRERELAEVMERLQQEEKNLHQKLEHIDHLNHRVNLKKTQLRQDQATVQQEEKKMSERLKALKEKEIFVNCQMVKLHSQEAAIKHRKRELQKERLRIEKLAYLIFKTDLSTTSYREFNNRIARMQQRLEKRYRKLKLLEHYCQHKSLPPGMKLEPITPTDQNLDPALAAFEEALWGTSKGRSEQGDSTSQVYKGLSTEIQRNSSLTQDYRQPKPSRTHCNPITGQDISDKDSMLLSSTTKSNHAAAKSASDGRKTHTTSPAGSSNHDSAFNFNKNSITKVPSSDPRLTATKKSKSEQEGQIVKQASSHMQRLVMSAKETCASAFRLLQTPVPEVEEEGDENRNSVKGRNSEDNPKIQVIMAEQNKCQSPQSNPDPDNYVEEEFTEEIPDGDDDLYSMPYSDTEACEEENSYEEEECGDNGKLEKDWSQSSRRSSWDSKRTCEVNQNREEAKDFESIFRKPENEKHPSSHSEIQSDPRRSIARLKQSENKSRQQFDLKPERAKTESRESRRSFLRTPPEREQAVSSNGDDSHSKHSTKSLQAERATTTTGNDGDRDRFSVNYDSIVQEQLAKLPETTRNDILYAIGQKTISQVAQAIDKASGHISKQSPSNPVTHTHGQTPRRQNPSEVYRPSDQATVRRGVKSPKFGPRRIPSHLKFGNFNIRHRNRQQKSGESFQQRLVEHYQDQRNQGCMSPQMRTSQTQTKQDPDGQLHQNFSSENRFPEGNFTVGIIAEKILGIHANSSSIRRESTTVTSKVSHTRAFRV